MAPPRIPSCSGISGVPRREFRVDPPGCVANGSHRAFSRPHAKGHKLASMNVASCDLDSAPILVATTSPFLNSISVGMPRT
jgi:hypothetical protein